MKTIILAVATVFMLGCGPNNIDRQLKNQVRTQTGCKDLTTYRSGSGWAVLDVCGKRRYYEYGFWCEECSASWRERK